MAQIEKTKVLQLKNKKVELVAKLDIVERTSIIEILTSVGANFGGNNQSYEAYYCNSELSSLQVVRIMKTDGCFYIRLKSSINKTGNKVCTINLKIVNNIVDHNTGMEYETYISSMEEMESILRILGYKKFIGFNKSGLRFYLGEMVVTVNDIPDFGSIVELETICYPGEEDEMRKQLTILKETLGINIQVSKEIITSEIVEHLVNKKKV